jgi:hypothetical protein
MGQDRSDSIFSQRQGWAQAPRWVRSLIQNPPQGLTALAPPEKGIVRLRRGMEHFHALGCSAGVWSHSEVNLTE